MLGSIFKGNGKKGVEEKGLVENLQEQNKYLNSKLENLKKEIQLCWILINQKESYIKKLEYIIKDSLNILSKKGEHIQDFLKIEADLQLMFRISDYYNPTEILPIKKEENKFEENGEASENSETESPEAIIKQESSEKIENIENIVNIVKIEPPQDEFKERSFSWSKVREERRYKIIPRDETAISRENITFELELKEYNPTMFDELKQFSSKFKFTPEDVNEEIDYIVEILEKSRYYQTVWPKNTRDKLLSAVDAYVYEIIHKKIFIVDEDEIALNQQITERMSILKKMITFDMLDIPKSLRKEEFFKFAIKEFQKISAFKSPTLKLEAFDNCTNHLINIYIERDKKSPNADELFPLMMYVVLNANVSNLKTHVEYT